MLPQSSVTLCGEHLLSLVQELEMFALSDALTDLAGLSMSSTSHTNISSNTNGNILSVVSDTKGTGWGGGGSDNFMKSHSMNSSSSFISSEVLSRLYKRSSAITAVKTIEQALFGAIISDIEDTITSDDITLENISSDNNDNNNNGNNNSD